MKKNEVCPICHQYLNSLWPEIGFDLCINCGLKIRKPNALPIIDELYSESWNAPDKNVSETGGTNRYLAKTYITLLKNQLGYDLSQKTILDFGAGRGDILEELNDQGAITVGIEPYGFELLQQGGFSVVRTINDAITLAPFDGVICIDVVEHLSCPLEDMKKIVDLLKPGGWLLISTPNSDSLRARIHGERWEEANRKGHLFLFTPKSLEDMLVHIGLNQITRLKWDIRYHSQITRLIINKILTSFKLDGELRYLAYK